MQKIVCIGEVIVDFIGQPGVGMLQSNQFSKHAGGAPANVAAAIAKLGGNAWFMGQFGTDIFGSFIAQELSELGVNLSLSQFGGQTTLSFVALTHAGERDFEFYRGSDGDYCLVKQALEQISANDLIHFGSATALVGGELRASYFQLLEFAESNNNFISFDPNYRENLISPNQLSCYLQDCKTFISYAKLVKLSESEAQLISGEDDLTQAVNYLLALGAETVVVTLGAKGALLAKPAGIRIIPVRSIQALDCTGAGDAFVGALLFKLAQHLEPNWEAFIAFANLVAAYTCTNYGAIRALPNMRQFLEFVAV